MHGCTEWAEKGLEACRRLIFRNDGAALPNNEADVAGFGGKRIARC